MTSAINQRAILVRIAPFSKYETPHPQEAQLPLELAYVAGTLVADNWDVTVSDGWLTHHRDKNGKISLPSGNFKLAIIQVETLNYETAIDIAKDLRNKCSSIKIIAIGQMAQAMPAAVLDFNGCFDACVNGEVELTIKEFASAVINNSDLKQIKGLVLKDQREENGIFYTEQRPLVASPDELAPPAYDCFDLKKYAKMSNHVPIIGPVKWGWLLSSRGCAFGCTFCSPLLRKSHGRNYRPHSVEYLLNLVDTLELEHGCNAIAIEDDLLTYSKSRTIEFSKALSKRKNILPWTAQARIDSIDEEMIIEMKKGGCAGLCIGIESATQSIREEYKKCKLTNREIEDIIKLVHSYGIHTTLYFMLGFPGETKEQILNTLDFARKLKPLMIQVAFFTPYPGSEVFKNILQEHSIEETLSISHYNSINFSSGPVDPEEIRKLQRQFYRSFYFSPSYLWRYFSKRFPYTLSQGREVMLALRTLRWMLKNG